MDDKKPIVAITVAIIGALALIAVPVVTRLVDIYLPTPTSVVIPNSTVTPSNISVIPSPTIKAIPTNRITPLTIDDLTNNSSFVFDIYDLHPTSRCTGEYLETGMAIVDYRINVPNAWAVIIDSWKAEWDSGSYNNNGILIIIGEWQGLLKINTGALCVIPVELLNANLEFRRNLSGKDGRPEFTIP